LIKSYNKKVKNQRSLNKKLKYKIIKFINLIISRIIRQKIKMKKIAKVSAGLLWVLPFVSFAQNSINASYINSMFSATKSLLDQGVVILVSLAVCWFIWNVVKYAMSEDEEGKEKARSQMIWGIIAIAVIVSIWGLVSILQGIFGANNDKAQDVVKLIP
jgi:hypothetical protein